MSMRLLHSLSVVGLLLFSGIASADNMIMGRVPLRAEIAIEYVLGSIEEHGYTVAHIQLCDGGLSEFGYKSDLYRVVFFGKIDEVRNLSERYPEMVSYLPLKIAVIAEKDETLLTVLDPEALTRFFADQEIRIQLGRWKSDLTSIFTDVRRSAGRHSAAAE